MLNATKVRKGWPWRVRRERNPLSIPVYKLTFTTNEKGERVLESMTPVDPFYRKPSRY